MRPVPEAAVFSRCDLRLMGWSDPAITRAVRAGRLCRLRRDQFTVSSSATHAAIAAVRGCTGATASDRSAALQLGLPLICPPPALPEVVVAPSATGDLEGAHLRRATLREQDVCEVDGVHVTSVARTVADLGRHYGTSTMVAAGDHALHHGLTTIEELDDVVEFCRTWPGAHRARRAIPLLDGRAESPLESVSRLTIVRLGLPMPELQQRIRNERGIVIARVDFYWDDVGVVGEADGRSKFTKDEDVLATWDRHTDLDDLGLHIVRWGWSLTRTPSLFESKLRGAFARGARHGVLGLQRRWIAA